MSSYKWSPEEEHFLRMMLATGDASTKIAEQLAKFYNTGLPGFRTLRSSEAIRRKIARDNLNQDVCKAYIADKGHPTGDMWEKLAKIQEQYEEEAEYSFVGVIPSEDITTKILCLSDIHFPFTRLDLIEYALDRDGDADILVLNGDILDGYVFSTFEKHRRIAANDEYMCAFDFIDSMRKRFKKVIVVEGNHDIRVAKAVKRHGFDKEASQVLRPNLLARIANGERLNQFGVLVEKLDFDNVIFQPRESWWVQVGKTLFIHPHGKGGSKPGHTVNFWNDKFKNRFPPGTYDSIICGHTHQIYQGVYNGTLLIEQGCLAGLMSYSWASTAAYKSNGMNGYAVIYQDKDGNTCFNSSQVVYLGNSTPPKKPVVV